MAVESKPLFHPEVTFVAEVKRIRGTKHPLTAAGLQTLRAEYTTTIEPARTLATEALKLERQINHLANQAAGLTPRKSTSCGRQLRRGCRFRGLQTVAAVYDRR